MSSLDILRSVLLNAHLDRTLTVMATALMYRKYTHGKPWHSGFSLICRPSVVLPPVRNLAWQRVPTSSQSKSSATQGRSHTLLSDFSSDPDLSHLIDPVLSLTCESSQSCKISALLSSGISVSGLNWVATQARSSGRPSIATMSLGGGASTSLDNAVASVRRSNH